MKISKRKDGRYVATMVDKRTNKRKYVYGKTKDEIRRKISAAEQGYQDFVKAEKSRTLGWCIDRWYEAHEESGVTYNTMQCYKKPAKDCKEWLGHMRVADVLPKHIDEFIRHLIACDYMRQTINLRYMVLCMTFDWAVKNRYTEHNSARQTSLPRGLPSGTRTRLTNAQVRKVKLSGDLYANTLLYTGMRRCEALAMRWEDIDFARHEIFIHQQLIWENGMPPQLGKLKTKNSQAKIPLLAPLEKLLLPHRKKSGFVFNRSGEPLTPRQFSVMWSAFIEALGENITPHQFRHEFISLLHDAGVDPKSAQMLARHSKFETTMNIYTELDEEANARLGSKINDFLAAI